MRVALAATLFAQPDLLLLDEPTNYLDLEGTLWLQDHLARYPKTMIIISHDRDLLDTAVGHILSLEARKLTLYRGGYSAFERQRRERLMLDQKMVKKQEAQRKHIQAFVDRFRAKATKARQAQSRLKMLARMEPIAALVSEEVRRSFFRRRRSFCRRRSSPPTTSPSATSPGTRYFPIYRCASTMTTASPCSAPTATASRRWSSCSPAGSRPCTGR